MSQRRKRGHKKANRKSRQNSIPSSAHQGNIGKHENTPEDPLPQTPASIEKQHSTNTETDTNQIAVKQSKRRGMTLSEVTMAVLTLTGLVVAALTGTILLKQTYAVIIDQRPWLVLDIGSVNRPMNAAGLHTLTAQVTIKNTGKTPASQIITNMVVGIVPNGSAPSFKYSGVARATESTGIMFPSAEPFPFDAALLQTTGDPRSAEQRFLSDRELQRLIDGSDYVVIYGMSLYGDSYGVNHWTRVCKFAALTSQPIGVNGAKVCTDYNAADSNQPALFTALQDTLFKRFEPAAAEDTRH